MLRILAVAFGLTALLGATAARAVPQYDFTPVTADMQSFVQAYALDGAPAGGVVYVGIDPGQHRAGPGPK